MGNVKYAKTCIAELPPMSFGSDIAIGVCPPNVNAWLRLAAGCYGSLACCVSDFGPTIERYAKTHGCAVTCVDRVPPSACHGQAAVAKCQDRLPTNAVPKGQCPSSLEKWLRL